MLEGDLFPAESTFVKMLALNFEMMLRFFVSGLKRYLAHGNFLHGKSRIAEPVTFFLLFSGLFEVSSVSKSSHLLLANLGSRSKLRHGEILTWGQKEAI